MNSIRRSWFLVLAFSLLSALDAANWPQWRGPNFNGFTAETGLPSKWSKIENVIWRAKLPGAGAATPVVWEDKVFVSCADGNAKTLKALWAL